MRYFLDTEFDGARGLLISLALVREDGHSLYCVTEHEPSDPWVRANVSPVVLSAKVPAILCPPGVTGALAADFLREDKAPVIVADWLADVEHLCRELAARSLYWSDPDGVLTQMPPLRFEVSNVDAYPTTLAGAIQHNAWWDAMALRHLMQAVPTRATSEQSARPRDANESLPAPTEGVGETPHPEGGQT